MAMLLFACHAEPQCNCEEMAVTTLSLECMYYNLSASTQMIFLPSIRDAIISVPEQCERQQLLKVKTLRHATSDKKWVEGLGTRVNQPSRWSRLE